MEENKVNISDELIREISVEELVELKIEVEEMISKLDSILNTCDLALNS